MAYHTHGGPGAQLGDARFVVHSEDAHRHMLTVSGVDFLGGRSCTEPPTTVKAHPTFAGLFAEDRGQRESTKTLAIPPKSELSISVGFGPSVEAYYVYCDRFAFRVRFELDGDTLEVVSETTVTREEPLRPDP